MAEQPVLSIQNLSKIDRDKVWFHPFSFQLNQGEVAAVQCDHIVGKVLLGILTGQDAGSGTVFYFGQTDSLPSRWKQYSHRIGLVQHEEGIYDRLTPYEYLKFYQRLYGQKTDIEAWLHKINLFGKKAQRIKMLTFSERKRLSFVRALLHHPDLVILEEPDQNIDLESKVILRSLIHAYKAKGGAAFILTSNMESAILITNDVYRLHEDGLKKMDVQESEEQEEVEEQDDMNQSEPEASSQVHLERIPAKVKEKIILFDPTEIDYVESVDGTVQLHVKGGSFPCTITLQHLTERLEPFGFFRCHRSYIVNLQKVREVMTWTRNSYSLILDDTNKSNIPLSKGKLQDLKDVLRM
ncbi:LytTR family transcriptional regulator DNA-binding domain-containing protein [Alkalicoccus urumqiensis]|uniref:Transcriptional regulator n=1 Tax=Alkalicoccus urumqiensis TaxID=1548213 RepID=A0A2P6MJE9_ALKUR|nr:LytTR family transcriptional regulator DNA-binding domain-containing protein [Alkalicoccus urumqiensis]PRO66397.1 transcriptional regulator [Alkalicoccus urumqiensis]